MALVLFAANCAFADFDTDPFYDQRVKLDAPPIDAVSEHIDPFSGNMQIVQTDLHLPGNGGLDLSIMRTYNSLIYSRRDDTLNPNYFVAKKDKSPLGIGWTMHMGILRYPQAPGTQWGGNPILELPDGTKQVFFLDKNNTARQISKDYWTLKTIAVYDYYGHGDYEVRSPEGIIYSFNNYTAAGYQTTDLKEVAQVVKIQNPPGTAAINITYYKTNGYSYLKTITDTEGRVVNFNYDYTKSNLLSISTDTRTISYTYQRIGTTSPIDLLKTVTRPVGNSWSYNYDTTYELNEVNYPAGGKNSYTYADVSFKTGDSCTLPYRVVTQKQTSGRGITGGTWTYAYNSGGSNITVVNGPSVTETHRFYGWGSGNISAGNVWKVGLPVSRDFNFNGSTMSESFSWTTGASVSNTSISNINWGCPGFLVSDSGVYPAFLSSKSVTRDGKTYTSNYSSFNAYGDPQTISESGDISRNRSISYWTNTSKNIVKGKPASESVSGSFPGTSTSGWTYDANSGNPTQITKNGITTNYGYGSDGNLSSVTDANYKTTSYLWNNGRISKVTNPIYSISRAINPTGTISSETNGRGYTTYYGYDGNLRLTVITPPVGNATSFTYPADSSYRKEARGGYWVQHNFDGFGRPTGSSDSKGTTTTVVYNAYGAKDYSDSNVGDRTNYDYFGRAKQVVHKDNTSLSYAYSGSNVTITDENNTPETFTYSAFGSPDEKYLMAVRDQASNSTLYTRNIHGSVTGISQGGINRSYTFNTKNFLTSESTPEGGSISYGRDNIGTMTWKTDATGTKYYTYDNLYRLTGITSGTGSIGYGYDNAGNRTSMTSPSGSFGYSYDAANRMTPKTETIAGKTYSTRYVYDTNDNITSQTYPTGRVISYGYNSNNQVTSINGFGGSVTSVNYNAAGLPTSFTTSNGITNNFTYNTRNLATAITAGSALNLSFGYDSRGNTKSITNQLTPTKNQTFNYDALSRLTGFSGAWGSGSFGYDSLGNRTSKIVAGSSSAYNYANNRLSSVSGSEAASYIYNVNGALNSGSWQGGSYTLTYDPFDNLASFKTGAIALADFAYDGDGMRVTKTAGGNTTVYHYDHSGNVLSENDATGKLISDYVYLNGKLVAKITPPPPVLTVNPVTTPTKTSSQALSGTREAGATISLSTTAPVVAGTVTYPTSTTWSCTVSGLIEGTNNINVTASDLAGNSNIASKSIILDTIPPTLAINSVSTPTRTSSQTITGTREAGATIVLSTTAPVVVGTVTYSTSTTWSCTVSGLIEGTNNINVTASDLVGNSNIASRSIVLDTIPPALTINAVMTPTRTASQTISGTRETGATIVLSTTAPVVAGVITYPTSTTWSCTVSVLIEGTNNINVTASDLVGNSNIASRSIVLDTIPPALTINPVSTPTRVSNQTITGTREAGATITISTTAPVVAGAVTYPTSTTWSCTVSGFVQGSNNINVTASDLVGNSNIASRSIVLDTIAPALTINPITTPTRVASQTITGTREADATITISTTAPVVTGAVTYPTSTTWSCTVSGLIEGTNNFSATATDMAGNSYVISKSIVLDTIPPALTINPVTTPTSVASQTITGTMEAGATIALSTTTPVVAGTVSYSTSTTWSCTISGLIEGANTVNVTATDLAGNSTISSKSIVLDTALPALTINAVVTPTRVASQTITGTMEAGATITFSTIAPAVAGAVTYPTSTTWSCTVSGLVEGTNTFNITASDLVGNSSIASKSIVLDTIPPAFTINPVTTPTLTASQIITGTREAGATVLRSTTAPVVASSVTYPTSTTWSCTVSGLVVGTNTFTISALDQATNSSSVSISISFEPPPLALTMTNTSIAADYQGTVGVTISNIYPVGSDVLIEQLVDANQNDVVDAVDYVIRSFRVSEGISVANPNMQRDTDGAVNSTVTTALNYFLTNDLYHTPGHYLFRATKGTQTAVVPFTVSPVGQSQTIVGMVTDGTSPIAGAMVQLTDKWQRHVAYAIADTSGGYVLNIKQAGEYNLRPVAYGYVANATPVNLAAGQNIENLNLNLTAGTYHLTGNIKDAASGSGISGVWVQAGDGTNSGIAMTDNTGAYDLLLPSGQYTVSVFAGATGPGSFAKGYAGYDKQPLPITVNANMAATDITLQVWDIVAKGRVLDQAGNPVPGLAVIGKIKGSVDSREPVSFGISDASGNYSIGLFSGTNWDISLDNMIEYLGTIRRDLSTTVGPLSGNDLTVQPITAWVQGVVKDSTNQPLSGVEVNLRNEDSSITSSVVSASDGSYRLGGFAGSWFIDALTEGKGLNAVTEQAFTLVDGQTTSLDFVADVTPWLLIVDPVTTPTRISSQIITGSMETGSTVTVTVNTAAVAGAVSYPTATTWSCVISGLVEEDNTITVLATDVVGNTSVITPTIKLDTTLPVLTVDPVFVALPVTLTGTVESGVTFVVKDVAGITGKVTLAGQQWTANLSGFNYYVATLVAQATDAAGNVSLVRINAPVPDGDLNGDGKVTTEDANIVIKLVAGKRTPTALQLLHGDVGPLRNGKINPNGKIDMTDALLIQKKAVGSLWW